MDPATILALLKIAEDLTTSIANLIASSKQAGDPTDVEVQDQLARNQAANDRLHAIANG